MKKVIKRDNSLENFNASKIKKAIEKAAFAVSDNENESGRISGSITEIVVNRINEVFKAKNPHIENIQDTIEAVLMELGLVDIAKRYILYREERNQVRKAKNLLGLRDDLKLTVNGIEVLRQRYLLKDDSQKIIETPGQLFRRTSSCIAMAEKKYRSKFSPDEVEEKFYELISGLEFMPNSPTLMNANLPNGQLSACFVLPVDDTLDGIFDTLKIMAKIHQTGGGTGFNFSHLRPRNDIVKSTNGVSSGPVSFISIYDKATRVMIQGGKRRGANMGILRCDHPDIMEFIEAKLKNDEFENFNLSVGITDKFMDAVGKNSKFELVNPRTKHAVKTIRAKDVFELIINSAWRCGDPGLVFLDEINRKNPTPAIGTIEATNPCGELPLLSYESCNLGSINLSKMVSDGRIDFERLANCIKWGVRFLDDVIDVNHFSVPEIEKISSTNRKIGLGVMGFADMLIKCGIPYSSKEAILISEKIMKFVRSESLRASCELAEERGVFANFDKSIYAKTNMKPRNATVNTIAPTGTISIIAGCSSGIEPLFGIAFFRNILSGTKFFEINPVFEAEAKRLNFFSDDIISRIASSDTLRNIRGIPKKIREIFQTTFDITPEQHLLVQAAFQKYTDNSVSKTINLPADVSVSDVEKIYHTAYRLKCKGITVYRYGSKEKQVLAFRDKKEGSNDAGKSIQVDSEYSGGCISGACPF